MIVIEKTVVLEKLSNVLGEERAEVVAEAAVEELKQTQAWVEISLRDAEEQGIKVTGQREKIFEHNGRTYKSKPITRHGRLVGRKIYMLHNSNNPGKVIRGWFGRILQRCWGVINPSLAEREAMYQAINELVQPRLYYKDFQH